MQNEESMAVDPEFVAMDSERLRPSAVLPGKTIRVIVGTPPGNLYDFWARLIADHIGKHIPGNPSFIVQNTSARATSSRSTISTLVAKPDGLTIIGSGNPVALSPINWWAGPEIQFDWAKFGWMVHRPAAAVKCTCAPIQPYKSIEEVRTAKEPPKCGAAGIAGPGSTFPSSSREPSALNVSTSSPVMPADRHRSRRRTRRNSLPRFYHRSVFRPRAISHLAQDRLRAPSLSVRQQTRCAFAAKRRRFRIDGPIQNAGLRPPPGHRAPRRR